MSRSDFIKAIEDNYFYNNLSICILLHFIELYENRNLSLKTILSYTYRLFVHFMHIVILHGYHDLERFKMTSGLYVCFYRLKLGKQSQNLNSLSVYVYIWYWL